VAADRLLHALFAAEIDLRPGDGDHFPKPTSMTTWSHGDEAAPG